MKLCEVNEDVKVGRHSTSKKKMHITARSPRFLTAFRFLSANLRSFAVNKITWPWFYMRCSKWLYVVRPSNRNVHMYNLKEK